MLFSFFLIFWYTQQDQQESTKISTQGENLPTLIEDNCVTYNGKQGMV